jgi:hypothetical protein
LHKGGHVCLKLLTEFTFCIDEFALKSITIIFYVKLKPNFISEVWKLIIKCILKFVFSNSLLNVEA